MKPPNLSLTQIQRDDLREREQQPLQFDLIKRMFTYTRPYAWKRNLLILLTLSRSVQLPLLAWAVGAIISGPISKGQPDLLVFSVLAYAGLAFSTDFLFHFRQRYALELGESVMHDLRNELFVHLQKLPMSFYNTTRLGRIISRMTSDIETIRIGV